MRVALVNSSRHKAYVPLSSLFLASYVMAHSEHEVEIVDANWEDTEARLTDEPWDVIGFSALTPDYENATRIARSVRGRVKAPMLIGGIHVTCLPESMRECFDKLCVGEGEHAFLSYLNGGALSGGTADLKTYPTLRWDLLHDGYFKRKFWEGPMASHAIVPLVTSRGCPYHCKFCAAPSMTTTVRRHTAEWTVAQFEGAARRGATLVTVFDDIWTLSVPWLRRIAQLKKDAGLDWLQLTCNARVNYFSDDVCDVLKELNVISVLFGFESGNQRVLSELKRDTATVKQAEDAVARAHKHGLNAVGSIILGSPGETTREMLDTIRFTYRCGRLGARTMFYSQLIPYPGSESWKTALKEGHVRPDMNFDELRYGDRWVLPFWIVALMELARLPMLIRKGWQMLRSLWT